MPSHPTSTHVQPPFIWKANAPLTLTVSGPAEADSLTRAGAVPARLGPTVLRSSSAGAVAAALVLAGSGRWA